MLRPAFLVAALSLALAALLVVATEPGPASSVLLTLALMLSILADLIPR